MNDLIDGFAATNFRRTGTTRHFALKVEGFDLSGPIHYVMGVDLSAPEQPRVRVFLRDLEPEKMKRRPSIWHYATNPFANLSQEDLRNTAKMQAAGESMEAKCFTAPGGVLMIQGAYLDDKSGAYSASWINRLATAERLADGETVVLPNVMASMSMPIAARTEGKPPYCAVSVVHPEKGVLCKSLSVFNQALFDVLSTAPTAANGKLAAVLKMVNTADGRFAVKMFERQANKVEGSEHFEPEAPVASVERFWSLLGEEKAKSLREHLEGGKIEIMVTPATTWRVVGRNAESLTKPANKRLDLPHEAFVVGAMSDSPEAGFLPCAVSLFRHKPEDGAPASGDEDYSIAGVYLLGKEAPVGLGQMAL